MQTISTAIPEKDTARLAISKNVRKLSSSYNKILVVHWQRITFWLIMALAGGLRLYQFPNTPAGLWADEITEAVDAYALLQHGTDRWGHPFPFYFPGWGSGQNVLQAYLSIPFIQLFGLNAFSIRIIPVTFGILAVAVLYLTMKKIYGTNTALLAAFLLATLPWHVMASRWGLESNLFPFCFLFSIYILLCCYDSPRRRRWIPLSLIPLAISFYAYGTSIIPIPIFLALFIFFNRKTILQEKMSFIISGLLFLLIAAPFLLFILENQVLHKEIRFLSHLPFTIPYLPANRLDQVNRGVPPMTILMTNIRFVIGGYHDKWPYDSVPWISPLGWLVPPFAALGVYFSLKRCQLSHNLLIFALIGTLPTFILFLFNVYRSNDLYIPLIALSAYGIISLLEYIQPVNSRVIVTLILVGTLFLPNMLFYRYYFTTASKDTAPLFNPGYDKALSHALVAARSDEPIFTPGKLKYVDIMFYRHADAQEFRAHADIQIVNGIYKVSRYGRYYFTSSPALTQGSSYIAILKSGERLPSSCQRTEVFYQDNTWTHDRWTVERCYLAPKSPARP